MTNIELIVIEMTEKGYDYKAELDESQESFSIRFFKDDMSKLKQDVKEIKRRLNIE